MKFNYNKLYDHLLTSNYPNITCQEIQQLITHKITIPRFGTLQQTESLNVATATAIVLSEFCRNLNSH